MNPMVAPAQVMAPVSTSGFSVNFDYQLQLRKALYLKHPELNLPRYLLAPEIRQLAALPLNHHHRMILLFLFNTGARVSECLDITPKRIDQSTLTLPGINGPQSLTITTVTLRTLKQQRREKSGNASKDSFRTVTIYDPNFARELMQYKATYGKNQRLPLFRNHDKSHAVRINSDTGRKRQNDKPLSDQTVRNWFKRIEALASENGLTLSIGLNPHVLRHSCAIHLLLNGFSPEQIGLHLGHKSSKSTRIYTDLLAMDGMAFRHVQF